MAKGSNPWAPFDAAGVPEYFRQRAMIRPSRKLAVGQSARAADSVATVTSEETQAEPESTNKNEKGTARRPSLHHGEETQA